MAFLASKAVFKITFQCESGLKSPLQNGISRRKTLAGFGELVCWMVGLLGCRGVVMSGGFLAGCWLDGLLAG